MTYRNSATYLYEICMTHNSVAKYVYEICMTSKVSLRRIGDKIDYFMHEWQCAYKSGNLLLTLSSVREF